MVNKKAEGTYEDTLNKSEAFFVKHGKTVIIAIAAVIVVVAGVFLYRNFIVEPQEEEASTELAQAQKLFQTQQYDQALKAFQKVQSDYSSTNAGNLANLYVGLCYAHQEKPNWAKALENVQKFSTADDQIISPASQMALGDIYANNNQNDKAVDCFKKAAKMADAEASGLSVWNQTNNPDWKKSVIGIYQGQIDASRHYSGERRQESRCPEAVPRD